MPLRYARIAKETVLEMERQTGLRTRLGQLLISARENTIHHKEEDPVTLTPRAPESRQGSSIAVTREDTLVAARRLRNEGCTNPCVLNFADAFEPGGLFLQGVTTQEERLARCTGLYWCIKGQPYYQRNTLKNGNRGLFLHDILYSPQVPVFRSLEEEEMLDEDAIYPIGIVTSPAPQAYWARNNCTEDELIETFLERIRRILTIMANHEHDGIVLGAFGCGAFYNAPEMVATVFNSWLQSDFKGHFNKVVFGVYEREGEVNLETFRRIIQTE